MSRVDQASRLISAGAAQAFSALVDPEALVRWLPPAGMTGHFERFEARPGGSYRLVLTYPHDGAASGKSTSHSDVVEARFLDIVPGERVVQAVDFVSDDPAFAGTMTMTWAVSAEPGGTRVEITAEDVPSGISPEDHAAGLGSSLENLAAFLEDGAPDADDLLATAAAWNDAIVANDAERIADHVTADWVVVSESGVTQGTTFLALVAAGELTHSAMAVVGEPRVRVLGDTALVTARITNTAHFQGRQHDADEWTTDVYVKQDGRWLCALTHYTAAAPP